MSTFVNNNVNSGDVVQASDHNTQGANLAAVINGGLDNANISPTASIASSKLASGAAEINGAWQDWTPTYSNITVGDGTVDAKYKKIGNTVFFRWDLVLGSTSAIGTNGTISFPVTSIAYPGSATRNTIGRGIAYNENIGITYPVDVKWNSTTTMTLRIFDSSTSNLSVASLTSSSPFTWAEDDELYIEGFFEAA